ncbi:MAG: NAD(P)H-hydrate epimerase, partial [Elusimicrobia bacterium]|nr:NAD(P)H-hydrate epimerase [Elusimicrobiota bacterium]
EAPSGAIAVCCGRGSNGGDGLAAARELARRGFGVTVFLCPPKAGQGYSELLEDKLERARRAGALILSPGREERPPALARAQAAIDALLGTGFRGRPEGDVERMIRQLNDSGKPVLAVDLPSGLDPDTGARAGSCVAAAATVTLGLVKRGLLACQARPFVGRLTLADIGYPRDLLRAA